MKSKLIILGCGSSVGVPRIDYYWGQCKKKEKNLRTRCSALITSKINNILIDTSPDLRQQLINNNIGLIINCTTEIPDYFDTHFDYYYVNVMLSDLYLEKGDSLEDVGNFWDTVKD